MATPSPQFITAPNKERLRQLIALYQARRGGHITVINITPDPEGGWTAWYYDDPKAQLMPEVKVKLENGEIDQGNIRR